MYTNVKVNISVGQKEKPKRALTEGTQLSLHLSHSDLAGEYTIAVTQSQLNKLNRAKEAGKGVNIKMSKTQVRHNMKVHGGYPITSGWISFTGSSFYYWHGFASFRSWRSIICS